MTPVCASCPNEATLHILSQLHHASAVLACPDHADGARNRGPLRAIHTATEACADPRAHWLVTVHSRNECVLDRDPLLHPGPDLFYEAVL